MAASPASPHLELWKDPCMAVECSTLEAKCGRHHDVGHAASHARDTLVDPAVQRLEAVPIDVVCEYCKFYIMLLMLNALLFCFVHIVYCVNKNKIRPQGRREQPSLVFLSTNVWNHSPGCTRSAIWNFMFMWDSYYYCNEKRSGRAGVEGSIEAQGGAVASPLLTHWRCSSSFFFSFSSPSLSLL